MIRFERGQGVRLEARGSEMWFKARGETTGGRFSLMERTLPPGGRRPPAHRHVEHAEAYFVLEGRVAFFVEGDTYEGGEGCFGLVQPGEAHSFANRSDVDARLLVLHAPALDGYFAELEQLWGGATAPDPGQERALMARHGMEPVTDARPENPDA